MLLVAAAAAMALLGLLPPERFPIYTACPAWTYLHLLCPGCGATRALASLLHGDLRTAWRLNPLFLLLLPAALGYLAIVVMRVSRGAASPWPRLPASLPWGVAAAALGFTVARNL